MLQDRGFTFKVSLVVLEKGDCTWDTKVLGCWETRSPWAIRLASDGDWLAVLERNKVKLWHGSESGQEIVFPEPDYGCIALVSTFQESLHLILGKKTYGVEGRFEEIMVYKMEDAVPCLVKSIKLDGILCRLFANQFCLGFWVADGQGVSTVHQFMKQELIAAEISPDETERREIRVEGAGMKVVPHAFLFCEAATNDASNWVSMNSTCYVAAARRHNPTASRENPPMDDLWKTDLWMSNNIL